MRSHNTKEKGDVGVAHAIADIADQGFLVLHPLTEHAPFDLVAYRDGRFVRVLVKYRALSTTGALEVQFKSTWSDAQGTYMRPLDKNDVDIVCIYCPQTAACYYVDPKQFVKSVTLRVTPTRNGQQRNVLDAAAFRELPAGAGRTTSP